VILISTSSLVWYWIHKVFQFVSKVEYFWIDLSLWDLNYDLWDWDYIASLVKEFNVPVLSITAPDRWMDKKSVDKILKIAEKVWTQVVTFSPPHFSDTNSEWFYKYLPKIQKEVSFSICIKNVEPKFIFFIIPKHRSATLVDLMKITWSSTLDISAIDSSSWIDILKAQNQLWDTIKNILFSDKHWQNKRLLPWQSWWGISHLPLESFLMKLKTYSYNWFITLDVNPSELSAWDEEVVIQKLENFKKYYRKYYLEFK
jgi:hypothetical protein